MGRGRLHPHARHRARPRRIRVNAHPARPGRGPAHPQRHPQQGRPPASATTSRPSARCSRSACAASSPSRTSPTWRFTCAARSAPRSAARRSVSMGERSHSPDREFVPNKPNCHTVSSPAFGLTVTKATVRRTKMSRARLLLSTALVTALLAPAVHAQDQNARLLSIEKQIQALQAELARVRRDLRASQGELRADTTDKAGRPGRHRRSRRSAHGRSSHRAEPSPASRDDISRAAPPQTSGRRQARRQSGRRQFPERPADLHQP